MIFLKITASPGFKTTVITGPSFPIIKTCLSWSFYSKTSPFFKMGYVMK